MQPSFKIFKGEKKVNLNFDFVAGLINCDVSGKNFFRSATRAASTEKSYLRFSKRNCLLFCVWIKASDEEIWIPFRERNFALIVCILSSSLILSTLRAPVSRDDLSNPYLSPLSRPHPTRMPFHIASIRSETNTSLPMAHVVALNFLVPSHSPHIFVSFFWRKNKHGKSIRIASRQRKMKQEKEKKTRKVCSSDFFVLLSHFLRYYFQLG